MLETLCPFDLVIFDALDTYTLFYIDVLVMYFTRHKALVS